MKGARGWAGEERGGGVGGLFGTSQVNCLFSGRGEGGSGASNSFGREESDQRSKAQSYLKWFFIFV